MAVKGIEFDARDINRIKKYLKGAPKAVNAALRKAHSREANLIIATSQEYVPVITGLLKTSKFIGRASSSGTATKIEFGYRVKKARAGRDHIVDYAPLVEFGNSMFNVKFRGRFYLRRAVNSTKSGRAQRIGKFVRAELKGLL